MSPRDDGPGRQKFLWGFGPVVVEGYVNFDKHEVGVVVNVMGIDLGEFYGSPNDGVVVGVNVIAAKGQVKFFMRNERELWVGPQVDVLFDKKYETEARIV